VIASDSLIGLVTFGRYVFVHEIGFEELPKCYAFKGTKEYTTKQIAEMLEINVQ